MNHEKEATTIRTYKDTVFRMLFREPEKLLEQCRTLKEYAQYVDCVRKYKKTLPVEEAVDRAVEECIRQGILEDFLRANKAEVKSMSIFEYDEEAVKKLWKKEFYEDGYEAGLDEGRTQGLSQGLIQGKSEGTFETLVGLVRDGYISLETAAARANMSEQEFEEKMKSITK